MIYKNLIVLEGLDGTGKFTQFILLGKYMEDKGITVMTYDFPQYDTIYGELIGKYLRGDFGKLSELPIELPSLLYALDRYSIRNELMDHLKGGNLVLINRYIDSNAAYQGAKLKGKERTDYIEWIKDAESRMPEPGLVIFLDVPREYSTELIKKKAPREYLKGKEQDIHEESDSYQEQVREVYCDLAKKENWKIINCIENGELLPKSEISGRIIKVVEEYLEN